MLYHYKKHCKLKCLQLDIDDIDEMVPCLKYSCLPFELKPSLDEP
jgi:hypothetical protein